MKKRLTMFAGIILSVVVLASLIYKTNNTVDAKAAGCSTARPTAISGTIRGFSGEYHNWSVNVLIGIDLLNSSNQKVDVNGNVTTAGYSYTDKVNPNLTPPGSASVLDQTFGANSADGNGVLCVSSKVKTAWFELYPKKVSGSTDKTYYGGANDQRMAVKANSLNTYNLRLPTSRSHGGNTGNINGYLSYKKHGINPSNIQLRVFPVSTGTACGVQGFSAGADTNDQGSSKNYYKILNIAGGQCNAKNQKYKLIATCKSVCGSTSKTLTKYVYVENSGNPRVDVSF